MLPDADRARVGREKITGYLLSRNHPDGGPKARFFESFGFRAEEWQVLMARLLEHGRTHPIATSGETIYTIDGHLQTPDGRNPSVRTVWIVVPGSIEPKLVTAYPGEG